MATDTLELLKALVAIDSVNPSLVVGGAGEREIAEFVVGWARGCGLDAEVLEHDPGPAELVVRARGSGGGRTLLLCGHYDTVTVEGMADPHTPRLDGDRLHGRGAYDMKAGLAAALVACRELAQSGLAGDVVVAAVADEEHSSLGIQEVIGRLLAGPAIDAAIVTEPTEFELGRRAQGVRVVRGRGPRQGRARLAPAPGRRRDRQDRADPYRARPARRTAGRAPRPALGRASVHASTIEAARSSRATRRAARSGSSGERSRARPPRCHCRAVRCCRRAAPRIRSSRPRSDAASPRAVRDPTDHELRRAAATRRPPC